jgi:hypothetical protein
MAISKPNLIPHCTCAHPSTRALEPRSVWLMSTLDLVRDLKPVPAWVMARARG